MHLTLKHFWDRIESPELNPSMYRQLVSEKGVKNTEKRKGGLFHKQRAWLLQSCPTLCEPMDC